MADVPKLPAPPTVRGYVHQRTFFQHNRWSALDLVGELLANGVTQVSMALQGDDWIVSWVSSVPPDVLKEAAETDLC